jgi:hypothetical protein
MKKLLLAVLFILPCVSYAQEVASDNPRPYWKSASELIFSWGIVEDGDVEVSSVVRFSCFFHFQEQIHFDSNDKFGFWTGFGIRNIGMINDFEGDVTLKQRSYSLGVPVAIKVGNLNKDLYVSFGGEAELMFHYKQKAVYDDEKYKKSEWFSDRTNLINPSLFLDLNFSKGAYVRFKYYMLDFLVEDKQSVSIEGVNLDYTPEKSQLFYVALGMTFDYKKIRKGGSSTQQTYSQY